MSAHISPFTQGAVESFRGEFVVGLRPSLPFKDVDLLLGNDIAGDTVRSTVNVSDAVCVVTRSQTKATAEDDAEEYIFPFHDVSDTSVGKLDVLAN